MSSTSFKLLQIMKDTGNEVGSVNDVDNLSKDELKAELVILRARMMNAAKNEDELFASLLNLITQCGAYGALMSGMDFNTFMDGFMLFTLIGKEL